jgi:hypothetical protein
VIKALAPFDKIYRQPTGASPLAEVSERLAAAAPQDRTEIDLKNYRGLQPPWSDWQHVTGCGHRWASVVAKIVLQEDE